MIERIFGKKDAGGRERTGTSVKVASRRRADLEMPLEDVLRETAEALQAAAGGKLAMLLEPVDQDGTTRWDLWCQRYDIDRRTQVVGAHMISARLAGVKSDLLYQLEAQQAEAQRLAAEQGAPLGDKILAGARRRAAGAFQGVKSFFTEEEIDTYDEW